ncbi:hypothetical protein D9615_010639 [Tricholomella constricta]|uniref:Uncharacterized protein n=1 Tax=Tricholomella constricta TaxID=117010 RepID=A0A8H5GKI8_9AGAR|nr:hypothetical protein D9615_010639 [Tricholomella constricta]
MAPRLVAQATETGTSPKTTSTPAPPQSTHWLSPLHFTSLHVDTVKLLSECCVGAGEQVLRGQEFGYFGFWRVDERSPFRKGQGGLGRGPAPETNARYAVGASRRHAEGALFKALRRFSPEAALPNTLYPPVPSKNKITKKHHLHLCFDLGAMRRILHRPRASTPAIDNSNPFRRRRPVSFAIPPPSSTTDDNLDIIVVDIGDLLALPPPSPRRPLVYAVHTTTPIPCAALIAPYKIVGPLNACTHLCVSKPFVHLFGHPSSPRGLLTPPALIQTTPLVMPSLSHPTPMHEIDADSTYHTDTTNFATSLHPEPKAPPSSSFTAITTTPNASTRLPSPPSSTLLDTSTSTCFDENSRISLALSHGEVSIGLSLLQDLADGGSVKRVGIKRRGSALGSLVVGLRRGDKEVERDTTRLGMWRKSIRESVISEGSKYSSSNEGDTDSGLEYEDTETRHGAGTCFGTLDAEDELEGDITQMQRAFNNFDSTPAPSSLFTNCNSSLRSPSLLHLLPACPTTVLPTYGPALPVQLSLHRAPPSPPTLIAADPNPRPSKMKTTKPSSRLRPHTPFQHSFTSSFPMSPPPAHEPMAPFDDPAPFPFTDDADTSNARAAPPWHPPPCPPYPPPTGRAPPRWIYEDYCYSRA